jgi:hypothetical protein
MWTDDEVTAVDDLAPLRALLAPFLDREESGGDLAADPEPCAPRAFWDG